MKICQLFKIEFTLFPFYNYIEGMWSKIKRSTFNFIISVVFLIEVFLLIICVSTTFKKSDMNNKNYDYFNNDTIRILHNSEYSGASNKTMYELFNNYSNENHIQITCDSLYGNDFYLKLQADFSIGHDPDIVITAPGYNINYLYDADKLASLHKDILNDPSWSNNFDESILYTTKRNNKIYGIPMGMEYLALYSNNELLSKCGLDVPQSFNELLFACDVLKQNGITPIAFGTLDSDMLLYQATTASLGGYMELTNAIYKSELTPPYALAFERMQSLYQAGAYPTDFESIGRLESQQMFLDAKAAFIVESSSFANTIANFSTENYFSDGKFSISAFPTSENTQKTRNELYKSNLIPVPYGVDNMTIHVSKTAYETKHDEIIRLIKYLTSKDSAKLLTKERGDISSVKSLSSKTSSAPTSNIIVERNLFIGKCTEITPMPDTAIDKYVWYSCISSNLANIITGRTDASDVLSNTSVLLDAARGG